MELVGTAVSTILVGLLTMWAAVGGAAGLVVWLPSENLELHPYEGVFKEHNFKLNLT